MWSARVYLLVLLGVDAVIIAALTTLMGNP